MRSLTLIAAFILSFAVSAQSTGTPVIEKSESDVVKATWYHDNGTVKEVGYFKNGQKHGQWLSYDEKGNRISEANYKEGQKDGNWIFYHNNGTLHYQVVYTEGKKLLYTEWDSNGQLIAGVQNK
ncbi:MAG: toxin-antitoxin system YwqK family antitoxin [Bacteroidota bacterium]